ncbi:MAG: hypothetical protein IGS49_20445 [Chlorogloeopsis fritschii C42_A2020_084]|uniref:hypothetical protein n=1 Tax=Chlorogloeopsis fritschii TaxID=1124 RepID=UPI001A01C3C2|nr:hypothetical protein [Chlorogloeopsis fritschii]MBF2007757.1 hypothetical protein [Chlorogloeopsis fritschii C42_A2020_084]
MNKIFRKSTGLLGAICGGLLIGLPATPRLAMAQQQPSIRPSSQVNPCPSIFYEEPHNSRVLVPQGCPPNAFTQRLQPQATAPAPEAGVQQAEPVTPGTTTTVPVQPPLPQTQQSPIATVTPTDGKVNVRIKNNTNAVVAYEVIGHTGKRLLPGRNEVVLRDLPVAVTITAVRQDRGFLKFTPTQSESGLLELSLDEQTTATNNQGAIRIQENGSVFLN